MFYPCTEETSRLMIYFHANAEDVGLAQEFLRPIKETLYVRNCSNWYLPLVPHPGGGVPWLRGVRGEA